MWLTVGVDSVIQAPRPLTTSSQGAIFLPQMSIQTGTIVLDNIHTGKSVTIILKHPTNGMSTNRCLLWILPKVTILCDILTRTDRTLPASRADIVIKHKQNKTCQLIDMSVPSDSNISAKEFEKLSKYKDLEIEIAKMWKMKTKTIPVIVGALGMIKKGTQKYVNEIPGNLSLAEIQKIVLNNTAHILRRTLSL